MKDKLFRSYFDCELPSTNVPMLSCVYLVNLKEGFVYRESFTESTKLSLHSFVPSGTYVLSMQNADKIFLYHKVNHAGW